MTTDASELIKIRQLVENAEMSIRSAHLLLRKITGEGPSGRERHEKYGEMASDLEMKNDGEQQIIEGVFDGQNMIGPNGKIYPIPANYASKSKLVAGDVLKLTIMPDGAFLYKQIGPIERKRITGNLVQDEGQYKVVTEEKSYKVLLASVTYFKANVGDEVTVMVPTQIESEWGAIEHVIPKI